MIDDLNRNNYSIRKVVRELVILRKMSEWEENIFTTKIIDIILPKNTVFIDSKEIDFNDKEPIDAKKTFELKELDHIFIVMELVESDLRKIIK